jgi:N-acetylglucosamine kinase-like BadF-type ATPase
VPILNDAHLLGGALLTHHCPWGVAVIAGTGSVVVALDVREDGDVTQIGRRGGLGYLLGDDGSGEQAYILILILITILILIFPCLFHM